MSYAESGEDLLLASLLGEEKDRGFYVDVGAHHPKSHLKHVLFLPPRMARHQHRSPARHEASVRPVPPAGHQPAVRGVAEPGTATYYMFDDASLNGCLSDISAFRTDVQGHRQVGRMRVPVVPLKQVLDEHLPAGTTIDFLTVDVEGMDLDVLVSNDWSRYRPRFILVEIKGSLAEVQSNPIHEMLNQHDYRLEGKTLKTAIFAGREAVL